MSKLVVFDCDGTFLDSFGLFERVVTEYSREKGLPLPCLTTIKHGYGNPHEHDFKWGVSREEQVEHLFETFRITDAYSMTGEPEHTPLLFEGVEETLISLKNTGYTLAIITSKSEDPLLHLLEYHKVGGLFSAYRSSTDIKRRAEREKPAPDMLQSVMRELDFLPDATVMIGDTTMDIRMGRAANANTIGVTWGTHLKDHLVEAGAHHIVDTKFNDIAPVLKKIFG